MTLQPPAPRAAPRHAPPLRTPLAGAGVDRADASESALSFGGETRRRVTSQGTPTAPTRRATHAAARRASLRARRPLPTTQSPR